MFIRPEGWGDGREHQRNKALPGTGQKFPAKLEEKDGEKIVRTAWPCVLWGVGDPQHRDGWQAREGWGDFQGYVAGLSLLSTTGTSQVRPSSGITVSKVLAPPLTLGSSHVGHRAFHQRHLQGGLGIYCIRHNKKLRGK